MKKLEVIGGLDPRMKGVWLAHYDYYATGEGTSVYAQIVYDGNFFKKPMSYIVKEKQVDLHFEYFGGSFYPAAIEREYPHTGKFLDWNPEFKVKFYESFSQEAFHVFASLSADGHTISLTSTMHYNLS